MGRATHTCSFCEYTTTYKFNVVRHELNHHKPYEERPNKCHLCEKRFSQPVHLREHVRHMHTFEKPFSCNLCDAKFCFKSKLTRHTKYVHTKEKEFQCTECSMRFVTPQDRKVHFGRHHTVEGQQRQKKKEEKLAKFLTEKGFYFQREYTVNFSCFNGSFARVDFVLQLKNTKGQAFIVLLENDEEAHKSRPVSCEVKRMMDVYSSFSMDGNTLPVIWVRFNCDSYRIDGTLQKKKQSERFSFLETFLHNLEKQDHVPFSIQYLFYDCITVEKELELELFSNEDYNEDIKQYVQVWVD